MWTGRFEFGDGWAAYRGKADANTPHRHAAIQIAVAERGDVALRCNGGEVRARAIIVPPMLRHELLPSFSPVTAYYLEAEVTTGRALRHIAGAAAKAAPEAIETALRADEPALAAARLAVALGVETAGPLDARVSVALAFLRSSPGAPGAMSQAACAAGLSTPRLRQLAKEELGVALSQWLLWQKLGRASRAVASGAPLATAAAEGGFADQAHFTRTMRRMFGVTPRIAAGTLA